MHAPCKRKIYYRKKDHSNIQKFPVCALYGLVKSPVRKTGFPGAPLLLFFYRGTRHQMTPYCFSSFSTSVPSILLRAFFRTIFSPKLRSMSVAFLPSRSFTVAFSRSRTS